MLVPSDWTVRAASSSAAAFGPKKRTEFDPARSLITSEPVSKFGSATAWLKKIEETSTFATNVLIGAEIAAEKAEEILPQPSARSRS